MTQCDNPVNTLHLALSHAAYEGFPEYEYETRDWSDRENVVMIKKKARHNEHTMTVLGMFPQLWGSTALGFGGVGGQAMTTAYTIVIQSEQGFGCCVYFNGRLAYRVEKPNVEFFEDMHKSRMADVTMAKIRYYDISELNNEP